MKLDELAEAVWLSDKSIRAIAREHKTTPEIIRLAMDRGIELYGRRAPQEVAPRLGDDIIRRMVRECSTYCEMAKATGRSKDYCRIRAIALGIQSSGKGAWLDDQKREAAEMRKNGATYKQIAGALGKTVPQVKNWFRKVANNG